MIPLDWDRKKPMEGIRDVKRPTPPNAGVFPCPMCNKQYAVSVYTCLYVEECLYGAYRTPFEQPRRDIRF
jgi:hypothetical protein